MSKTLKRPEIVPFLENPKFIASLDRIQDLKQRRQALEDKCAQDLAELDRSTASARGVAEALARGEEPPPLDHQADAKRRDLEARFDLEARTLDQAVHILESEVAASRAKNRREASEKLADEVAPFVADRVKTFIQSLQQAASALEEVLTIRDEVAQGGYEVGRVCTRWRPTSEYRTALRPSRLADLAAGAVLTGLITEAEAKKLDVFGLERAQHKLDMKAKQASEDRRVHDERTRPALVGRAQLRREKALLQRQKEAAKRAHSSDEEALQGERERALAAQRKKEAKLLETWGNPADGKA